MADEAPVERSLLMRAMSKRRTWVCLFLIVYSLLLSSSWSFLLSIRSWYNRTLDAISPSAFIGLPTLYASLLYGGVFGLLSMGAALAVAIPATLVTWITVLVLLAFAGRPRRELVTEGRRVTADIVRIACKFVLWEGNIVAGIFSAASFFALLAMRRRGGGEGDERDLARKTFGVGSKMWCSCEVNRIAHLHYHKASSSSMIFLCLQIIIPN